MKKLLIFLTMVSMLLIFTTSVYAGSNLVNYYVVAYNNSTLGKAATGTHGYNYVMANPTTDKAHVSSIYVRNSGTGSTFFEVGWCSEKSGDTRLVRFFGAQMYAGMYWDQHFSDAPLDSNHYYTVRHISGSEDWGWWIDGTLKDRARMLGWTSGWSTASSERGTTSDTNYSHFWGLQSRNSSATWYS